MKSSPIKTCITHRWHIFFRKILQYQLLLSKLIDFAASSMLITTILIWELWFINVNLIHCIVNTKLWEYNIVKIDCSWSSLINFTKARCYYIIFPIKSDTFLYNDLDNHLREIALFINKGKFDTTWHCIHPDNIPMSILGRRNNRKNISWKHRKMLVPANRRRCQFDVHA